MFRFFCVVSCAHKTCVRESIILYIMRYICVSYVKYMWVHIHVLYTNNSCSCFGTSVFGVFGVSRVYQKDYKSHWFCGLLGVRACRTYRISKVHPHAHSFPREHLDWERGFMRQCRNDMRNVSERVQCGLLGLSVEKSARTTESEVYRIEIVVAVYV